MWCFLLLFHLKVHGRFSSCLEVCLIDTLSQICLRSLGEKQKKTIFPKRPFSTAENLKNKQNQVVQ